MKLPTQLLMSNSAVPAMNSNVPPHMKQATRRNVPPAMSSNVPPLMRSNAVEVVEDMEDMANRSALVYQSRAVSKCLNRTVNRSLSKHPRRAVPLFLCKHLHRWPRRFVVEVDIINLSFLF